MKSIPSAGAASAATTEQPVRVRQSRAPSRRLVTVCLVVVACTAIVVAATVWWQSGAEARRDEEAWKHAVASNKTAAYREYLTGGTVGAHSEEARKEIKRRLDAAVSRLQSRASSGNSEAVQAFVNLAEHARDAGVEALPISFVRQVQLGDADVRRLATRAGARNYAGVDHALSLSALDSYEARLVSRIASEMRSLGFDELPLAHLPLADDQPAIRITYSILADGELYEVLTPKGTPTPGPSVAVAGIIIRARYEFVVPRSRPLFVCDAEARPTNKLRFSTEPYAEMCTTGFDTISLKFTSLFRAAPE
ncbi:MAG: hypothetical protein IT175_12280 [Acidobacteria bacterium]|nr:hypothetical protein [Acidobacteriota bacterium]